MMHKAHTHTVKHRHTQTVPQTYTQLRLSLTKRRAKPALTRKSSVFPSTYIQKRMPQKSVSLPNSFFLIKAKNLLRSAPGRSVMQKLHVAQSTKILPLVRPQMAYIAATIAQQLSLLYKLS